MKKYLVYAVEDENNIQELLLCTLKAFSYEAKGFFTAEEMLAECANQKPDLVLLDVMLPGMDGMQALKVLRNRPDTKDIPIIMLTAKATESDKVSGLDNGADDYIAKPFGVLELAARIRAVLRRSEGDQDIEKTQLLFKDLCMDINKHKVLVGDQPVELTLKEYDLLSVLLHNVQKVVTREELLNMVWGFDFAGESRTLDMHIKTLRQKLGDTAEQPKYIKTVRGVGYTLA